jgi:hypothetical protein
MAVSLDEGDIVMVDFVGVLAVNRNESQPIPAAGTRLRDPSLAFWESGC